MAESEVKQEETAQDSKLVKKYVSSDDLYRRSSQYHIWSYTDQELEELKMQTNEKGRQAALKKFEEARSTLEREKPEVFATHGNELTSEIAGLVSFEEEQKYLHFFSQQIIQICGHFNMPTQVKATAIAFFKRFYLVNSVMEYKPRNILYTIVFLAAKLENYFISIESYCARLPKTKPGDILDLEFIVLQALKFTLLVHHPYRALYGFFLDFQLVLLHPSPAMYDVNIDTIGALYDKAKKWLNEEALLSEVSFLFTPPQIALAAMYDIDKRITDKYLKRKFLKEASSEKLLESIKEETEVKKEDNGEIKDEENNEVKSPDREQYETLVKTIRKCIQIAKAKMETSREESTKIDEKCFFALNPTKLLKKRIKAFGGDT